MRRLRWGLVASVALISCLPEVTVAPPEGGTVSVAVAASTITQGSTTQATANAADSRGRALTSEPRNWTSSAPGVASVNASGVVTGVAVGTANITATVLGRSASAAVTVIPAVASVAVSPATATRTYADTIRFAARALASGGAELSGRTFTWAITTGSSFANIASTGLVTPVLQPDTSTRTVGVSATAEGRTGTATLRLTRLTVDTVILSSTSLSRFAGDTVRLTAQPRHTSGTNLTQRTVAWTSSNTAVATVNASGLVTAVRAGTANIWATSEGKWTRAALTVSAAPVASVSVSPSSFTITTAGGTRQMTATARDALGNILFGRSVTWTSSNAAVATVSASGLVTAVANGSTQISAIVEGVTGNASATVSGQANLCAATSHTLGTTVVGSVTTADCLSSTGVFEDRFSFTTTTTRLVSYNVTPTGGSVSVYRNLQQNTSTGPSVFQAFSATGMTHAWYGPGTYHFRLGNTSPVSYSFTTNGAAFLGDGCFAVPVAIGSGLNFNWTSSTRACNTNTTTPSSGKYYNRWWIYLNAGQQVTLTMTSTAFDAFLELWTLVGSTPGTMVASNDDGAGNGNSLIRFTATTAGFYEVRSTTYSTNVWGLYNLAFATSPNALMAPDSPAAQERVSMELPAPRP